MDRYRDTGRYQEEAAEEVEYSDKMTPKLKETMAYLNNRLAVDKNFDTLYRVIHVGGREACIYLIDGMCKDELMQKMLQFFMGMTPEELPENAHEMAKKAIPYVEVDLADKWNDILFAYMSGVFVLIIDGYEKAILIDSRTYPSRGVSEPEKEKTQRGSKDGFVETVVFNSALIRRRIRSTDLRMEMMSAGNSSRTDIVICYMEGRVDHKLLCMVKERIKNIRVDALNMNQQSLAECIYQRKWYNPFPKFKYTERPDTASAHVLEGNIILLVDNSPSAMIIPTSAFDAVEEADDYYFPPITGTYIRLSRFLIMLVTYFLTPTFLLLMTHREWIPERFQFIVLKEQENIPLVFQFLILELAIDGLRLAAVNTPSMLNTPLSVMAALVLGEFSVNSGWFNSEVMLYMAFVAIANYTQSNYEMGYALKFMRIITLILTALFELPGYLAGIAILVCSLLFNKTMSGQSYLYPLFPFNGKQLFHRMFRTRMANARK